MTAPLNNGKILYADWQIRIEVPESMLDGMLENEELEETLEVASDAVRAILRELKKKFPGMDVYMNGLAD